MADAGFFKGTSADQDRRFSDKELKLLKSMKFPPEFDKKVDMRKVNMSVIRAWVVTKISELIGIEDEVLVEYAMGMLENDSDPTPDPRKMLINLTGFLTKDTPQFMTALWKLLIEAQESAAGVPISMVEAKKQEMRQARAGDTRAIEERDRRVRLDEIRASEREGRGGGLSRSPPPRRQRSRTPPARPRSISRTPPKRRERGNDSRSPPRRRVRSPSYSPRRRGSRSPPPPPPRRRRQSRSISRSRSPAYRGYGRRRSPSRSRSPPRRRRRVSYSRSRTPPRRREPERRRGGRSTSRSSVRSRTLSDAPARGSHPSGSGPRRDRDGDVKMDGDNDPRDKGKGPELKIRGQAEVGKQRGRDDDEQDEVPRSRLLRI
ncbi:PWI domain-containing protein [Trametopsis cervina]|nr:PWI domain-containing protein [Trametopsis cervina]